MPVDDRSRHVERSRKKWARLGQCKDYKGWLLVITSLASLLLAGALPGHGATLKEISGALETGPSHTERVDAIPPTSTARYAVRSRVAEIAGRVKTPGSDVSFAPDTAPTGVTLTAPTGGEIWAGGQPYSITWTVTDTIGLPPTPITLSVSYDGGTAWNTLATNLPDTGSYIWTTPGTVNTNQALVQVEVTNLEGGGGSDRSDAPFTIDSDPPAAPLDLTADPAGWTNIANFSVTWINPPDLSPIAGAWYKLDTPPATPRDGTYIIGATTIAGIRPTTDGAHPIYVWLQDTLDRANQHAYATTTLSLDRTPPPPPYNLSGSPARRWTNTNSFTETWLNPPDISGIVGAYYRLDEPGSYPTDGTFVSTTNTLTNIAVTGDGKHDLYLWLVDGAGNVSHLNRNVDPQVFWYDGTPPTSTVLLNPPLPSSGWYSTTVSVAFQGQDAPGGSGLDGVIHRIDEGPWDDAPTVQVADEGPHTIRYYAKDVAGNRDVTQELQLALDLTPPAVTLTAARPPEPTGWYTASVAFTLAVTDTLSGSPVGYYRLDSGAWQTADHFQVASEGTHVIEYYGQDHAGNRSAVATLQARMDTMPPTTAYLIEGVQGQNGWYRSPLSIRLIAADSGSGVAATYYRVNYGPWQTGTLFPLTGDGSYVLSFYSVDVAGNVESSFPVQVKVDTAAPGTPIAVEVSPATWNRLNRFSAQWANPTDLSGIAGAYYRLDSEPTSPADGTFSPQINRLDAITVPDEGIHRLFLWLRDVAGNADHQNRVETPPLRYDATPPSTTAAVQGVSGTNGWYRSPVTITLRAADLLSGVARLSYRLDEGEWHSTTAATALLNILTSGKHVLECAAEDAAGNAETIHRMTVWIDTDPPAAPIGLRAEPVGWQHYNSFRLVWTAPLDQSGIAGAYVKFGAPPENRTDGVFHAGSELVEGLQVPGEGKHDVYVWLRDRAGNSDHGTAVALPAALWYDVTSPVTAVTQTGPLGLRGWYLGPVSFVMSATDSASGLAAIRYQVNDGAWTTGASLTLEADGMHVVRITSVDVAGNEELTQVFSVNIDRQPPLARMGTLSRYQRQPSFDVSWQGSDPMPGSGLASFDVQVRDGYAGAWQAWFTRTTETRARFTGQRGHSYFFRVAARDVAGNRQPFTGDETYAVVETVLNGSFDTGNFSQWTAGGELFKAVIPAPGPFGSSALVARLGSEDYGPSLIDPGAVPVGSARILQMIRVPDLGQMPHPTLTFWYRVLSYDVMYSKTYQRWQDTLDVDLYDQAGQLLAQLVRAGNPTDVYGQEKPYDTGWKWATVDLRPYAGQTVHLAFSNWNRVDNLYNTWSYVDDIRVLNWPLYNSYLSFVAGGGGSGGTAAATEQPDEANPPAVPGDSKR